MTARERFWLRDGLVMALAILLAMLCIWVAQARGEMSFTIGPTYQSVKASPFDCDVSTRCTVTEAQVKAITPLVWGELIFRMPTKFQGSFTISQTLKLQGVELSEKDGEIQYDGQVSTQRCKLGFYPRPGIEPYLTVVSRTSEWTFVQTPKSGTEKRVRSYRPATGIGGGVKLVSPVSPFLLAYGDGSWDTIGWGIEGGIEARYQTYMLKAFGRKVRDTRTPTDAWEIGAQAGMGF